MIDLDKHPYQFIELLRDNFGGDLLFEFSRYIHSPQQLLDKRYTFTVPGSEICESWAVETIQSLGRNEELALHSLVKRGKRYLHIPMVDFVCNRWSKRLESELRKYMPNRVYKQLVIFSSGRSFHAYGITLLEQKEWRGLMGRLLLINPPEGEQYIDARWIGHRLIGGFSSLRWSCNTSSYKKYPELMEDTERIRLIVDRTRIT